MPLDTPRNAQARHPHCDYFSVVFSVFSVANE